MDFQEATDRLIELEVPLRELAEEIGVSHALLMAARMDPNSAGYRNPPAGWREGVLRIAESRTGAFQSLAAELREGQG